MNHDTDTKIGVFFGSRSPEHDVSIITGQLIISGLKKIGYTVYPIYISKSGEWYSAPELEDIDFFRSLDFESKLKKLPKVSMELRGKEGKMVFEQQKGFPKKQFFINMGFPAFHGSHGEDGSIQGLFELANIPYVGCNISSSAVAMDKVLTKMLYQQFGVPTTDFISFTQKEWEEYQGEILKKLQVLPGALFVKPARTGSSIGITKVVRPEDIEFAVEVAFHYDSKVLVEKAVSNLADLTVCVMGSDTLEVSEVQESTFSKDFFSYEDKYLEDGGAQLGNAEKNITIPADIDRDVEEKIKNMAKEIFTMFECQGIARVDFLLDRETGKLYANEINPLPGTLYHHLWSKSGVPLSRLLKTLLRFAGETHRKDSRINQTFKSEILQRTNSNKLTNKLQINE